MGNAATRPYVSHAAYLELERAGSTKHEWLNGEVYDMAGGTPDHARLQAAAAGELRAQLRGRRCCVFSSDLRIRVLATGLATYPDLSVVCGKLEKDPGDDNAVTNPTLLVEVLSDSTEGYDRGEKFAHYRRIPSLKEYVLISQREPHVEVWRKNAAGKWELAEEGRAGESVPLASLECTLLVDEVYADPLREA